VVVALIFLLLPFPYALPLALGSLLYAWGVIGYLHERFHVDELRLHALARLGGFGYTTPERRFEMPPNRTALKLPEHP
jgi:hypothetical protein